MNYNLLQYLIKYYMYLYCASNIFTYICELQPIVILYGSEDGYTLTVECKRGYQIPLELMATVGDLSRIQLYCHEHRWITPMGMENGCVPKNNVFCERLAVPEFVTVVNMSVS